VEYHGTYYDVPECQILPAPTKPIPFIGGGHSPVALRRTAELCDGWVAAGAYPEDEAWAHLADLKAAREAAGTADREGFRIFNPGWVEYHGTYYDVPECQILPAPTKPIPFIGGGHSPVALRRTAELCDGWVAAGAYPEDEAWAHLADLQAAREAAGTADREGFRIFLSLFEMPSVELYTKFSEAGVTDFICAPWMMVNEEPGESPEHLMARRLDEVHKFADEIVRPCAEVAK